MDWEPCSDEESQVEWKGRKNSRRHLETERRKRGQLAIADFNEDAVDTMTMVAPFKGKVDKELAFRTLPITEIDYEPPKRSLKKFKIPDVHLKGDILALCYEGKTRGIVTTSSTTYVRNMVGMYMSTKAKNINLKLGPKKIQLCGAKSKQIGRIAVQHLLDHLNRVQRVLEYLAENEEETQALLAWLSEATKGKATYRTICESYRMEGGIFCIRRKIPDFHVAHPTEIPEQFNAEVAQFLLMHIEKKGMKYQSVYLDRVQKIVGIRKRGIMTGGPLRMITISSSMKNFTHKLGFIVNRKALRDLFNHYDPTEDPDCEVSIPSKIYKRDPIDRRFYARFNTLLESAVSIVFPCGYQGKKRLFCSFIVRTSGSVSQSGQGDDMDKIYYIFMHRIQNNERQIRKRKMHRIIYRLMDIRPKK